MKRQTASLLVASLLLIGGSGAFGQPTPPGCDLPPTDKPEPELVYSRKPADLNVYPFMHRTLGQLELPGAVNWQRSRDVGAVWGPMAEEDLVHDDNGVITVIEECIGKLCAATEPAFSPSGDWVAYTYNFGVTPQAVKVWDGPVTKSIEFVAVRSEIRLYHIPTGRKKTLRTGNFRDWAPSWASETLVVFSSDKESGWPNMGWVTDDAEGKPVAKHFYPHKGSQIWRCKVNGKDCVNLTPHEQLAYNPWVMSNGDVCFSTWQGFGERAYKHSSPRNDTWPVCIDINGKGPVKAELFAHGYNGGIKSRIHTRFSGGVGHITPKACRPIVELRPGFRACTLYYRSNHTADRGIVVGYKASKAEGALTQAEIPESVFKSKIPGSGRYLNSSIIALTPYGNEQDTNSRRETAPPFRPAGKAGAATPSTNGRWVFVHSPGETYRATPLDSYKRLNGEPWAWHEIREALVDIVTDPFDPAQSRTLACPPESGVLCTGPRVRMKYSEAFGIDTPAIAPIEEPNGDKGLLAVAFLPGAELHSVEPNAHDEKKPGILQNNAHKDYAALVADGGEFCVRYVKKWDKLPDNLGFMEEGPEECASAEVDGSVALVVDCERDFIMFARDKNKREIALDRMPHSLRCGEVRACHGCHDGHSEKRAAALGDALDRWFGTEAAKQVLRDIHEHAAKQ